MAKRLERREESPVNAVMNLRPILRQSPVIAALRRDADVELAAASNVQVVFVLCGDINSVGPLVGRLKGAGKTVFVHVDLIPGLAADQAAVTYLAQQARPDGIISTRGQIMRAAAENGMAGIQRLFIMDSAALETGIKHLQGHHLSAVELLPGTLPRWVIESVRDRLKLPVVAGGLLRTQADVDGALERGAFGVSVSNAALWPGTAAAAAAPPGRVPTGKSRSLSSAATSGTAGCQVNT